MEPQIEGIELDAVPSLDFFVDADAGARPVVGSMFPLSFSSRAAVRDLLLDFACAPSLVDPTFFTEDARRVLLAATVLEADLGPSVRTLNAVEGIVIGWYRVEGYVCAVVGGKKCGTRLRGG